MLNPLGRNWGPQVNWDSLGKFFAAFSIAWTVILYSGIAWLLFNRSIPSLKMRNIPLVIAATSCLHIYLIKILLAYTTNGNFLCSAEFWIMSIYLPFGIALFQANMVQLLSVSTQQRKLLDGDLNLTRRAVYPGGVRGLWTRWNGLNPLKQAYVFIGIGMLVQTIATAAIYATNEKLQGHWGNIAKPLGQLKCRKGPEWIPSSFWQLFWSGIYGPYLLYKVRDVRDTHYWRLQVIICVISGIPGAPLWLAAVFSPAFKPINKYWVPPMWLAPGIIIMQACTVFFPIYESYTTNHLSATTLSALREWEKRENWQSGTDDQTLGSKSAITQNTTSSQTTTSSQPDKNNFTMAALEHQLLTNPTPLLNFAATRDFTAENIIFLIAVRDWKNKWNTHMHTHDELFSIAHEIYLSSVCEKHAEFPINIEGVIRTRLDNTFSSRDRYPNASHTQQQSHSVSSNVGDEVPLSPLKSPLSAAMSMSPSSMRKGEVYEDGMGIDEKVFDAAEKSIKYLVLTNTWRKYINELGKGSARSSEETLSRVEL